MNNKPEERLIWETYVKEDFGGPIDHSQFVGDPSVEPMARMEPQEAGGGDEPRPNVGVPNLVDKGSVVRTSEGAIGIVLEMPEDSSFGIIKLIENDPKGDLERGDRMTVHMDDVEKLADSIDDYEDDVPWDESASRIARDTMDEDCGCGPVPDMSEPQVIKVRPKKKKAGIPSGLLALIKKLIS